MACSTSVKTAISTIVPPANAILLVTKTHAASAPRPARLPPGLASLAPTLPYPRGEQGFASFSPEYQQEHHLPINN
jgi:hypothetical protein